MSNLPGYFSIWINNECRDIVYGTQDAAKRHAERRFGKVIGLKIEPSNEETANRFHSNEDED